MDLQIKGKLAFVTAGAHGIGEAIADVLTREGAVVVVADFDGAALKEKADRWSGVIAADLASAEGMDTAISFMLKKFGRAPDILVNNLGVGNANPFEETSDEQWLKSININLMGCVRTCRALIPRMAELGSAAVVNVASDLAKQPEPTMMDYGSCKAALLYLTKALAKQYVPKVRVNAVLPGPVWTRMWSRPGGLADQLQANYGLEREQAIQKFLADRQLPMGIGQPDDVANMVAFLASPVSKFITGANIDIGGTIRGLI